MDWQLHDSMPFDFTNCFLILRLFQKVENFSHETGWIDFSFLTYLLRNGDLPQSADCDTHTHTHRPLRAMCFGYSLFLEDINNDFAGGSLSYVLVILMSFTFLRLPRSCPSLCPSLAVVFVRLSVFCSEYVSCCCRRNFLMWSLRASEDCIRCRVCFCVW